jgi:O-antigen/teichoic acid export membrane protein
MVNDSLDEIQSAGETRYKNELVGITKNAGLTAFAYLFLIVVSFFTNAVITRTLGADDYGMFVLATRILDVLILVATFGFGATIVRNVSFYHARNDHRQVKGIITFSAKTVFVISLAVVALGFLSADLIAGRVFDRPELARYIRILALSVPIAVLTTVFVSSLNGLKRINQTLLIANFLTPSTLLILVIIAAIFSPVLHTMIWIIVATGIGGLILSFYLLRKTYLKDVAALQPEVNRSEMWKYAVPMFFNQLFNSTMRLVPVFVMGIYLTNFEIGIFNVGFKIALLVSFSLSAFHLIFAPVMSGLFAKNEKAMIGRLYKTVTKWIFSASLMVYSIIILYSETLLAFFGTEFTAGVLVMLILATGELINATVGQAGNLLILSGRPRIAMYNSIATFVLVTLLSLLLIPLKGATGSALAVAISVSLINIARVIELIWFEKMHPFKWSFLKPLVAAAVSFTFIYTLNVIVNINPYLKLLAGSAAFSIIFVALNWMMKLDIEDNFILNHITGYFTKKRHSK